MGSKTKTFQDINLLGIMDDEDADEFDRKLLLERGKHVNKGSKFVNDIFGTQITDTKGMYSDQYLKTMGFKPSSDVPYNVVDIDALLSKIQVDDPSAVSVVSSYIGTPTEEDLVDMYLQDGLGAVISNDEDIFYNNKNYTYDTSVSNGANIDVVLKLAPLDTFQEYMLVNHPTVIYTNEVCTYIEVEGIKKVRCEYLDSLVQIIEYIPVVYEYLSVPNIWSSQIVAKGAELSETVTKIYPLISYLGFNEGSLTGTADISVSFDGSMNVNVDVSVTAWSVYYSSGEEILTVNCFDLPTYNILSGRSAHGLCSRFPPDFMKNTERDRVVTALEEYTESIAYNVVYFYKDSNDTIKVGYYDINTNPELITTANASSYPILPLKKNGKFLDENEDIKLNSVLDKVGLSSEDFIESLSNRDLKDSALMFGLKATDVSQPGLAYLFEFYHFLAGSPSGGSKTYSISTEFEHFKYKFHASFKIDIKQGVIDDVNKYSYDTITENFKVSSIFMDEGYTGPTSVNVVRTIYKKQISANLYGEITVYSNTNELIVSGFRKYVGGTLRISGSSPWNSRYSTNDGIVRSGYEYRDSEDEAELGKIPRVPIIREVINKLKFKDHLHILSKSLFLLAYSYKQVKIKWYQTGLFKVIMIVIVVIIAWYTGYYSTEGIGAATSGTAGAAGGTAGGAGAAGGASSAVAAEVAAANIIATAELAGATAAATAFGLNIGLQVLAAHDPDLAAAVGVAFALQGGYTALASSAPTHIKTLATVSALTSTASNIQSVMLRHDMRAMSKELARVSNMGKEAQEELEKLLEGQQDGLYMPMNDRDVDTFYERALGNYQYDNDLLYNYERLYTIT